MEYAEHGDLTKLIQYYKNKRKNMPEKVIMDLFVQITKGLRDVHKMQIIHRDIKSANIFLYKDHIIKIGDFNVSKIAKSGLAKTQTGTP